MADSYWSAAIALFSFGLAWWIIGSPIDVGTVLASSAVCAIFAIVISAWRYFRERAARRAARGSP